MVGTDYPSSHPPWLASDQLPRKVCFWGGGGGEESLLKSRLKNQYPGTRSKEIKTTQKLVLCEQVQLGNQASDNFHKSNGFFARSVVFFVFDQKKAICGLRTEFQEKAPSKKRHF